MVNQLLLGRSDRVVHAGGVLLAAGIFAIDLAVPLGGAVGVAYVLIVLLGLWTNWLHYPLAAALLATVLLAADTAAGWRGDATGFELLNRSLLVVMFFGTAFLVMRFAALQRQARAHVEQLEDVKRALDHAAIVATTDVSGTITYANDKFVQISGYAREELLGQDHRILNSGLHSKEFIRDLWVTIANGRVWHGEIRNRAKDGHFYWVDTTIVPFLNAHGKPYQYIAIRADITARKAVEQKLAEQAALARVGQMAAVVAHEVRNPLAGIKGALQILMSRRPAGDGELPVMRDVVARIDALSELINDLMVFARPRPPRLTVVELKGIVNDAITMVRRDPGAQGTQITVRGDDVSVSADGELVRAMVLNLLLNAAQALTGRGHVTVTVARRDDSAVLEVRDNGPGIPPEIREQIFEPFFTTKARGGGLGLPIARRTAELHGGSLTLQCPDEGGTIVSVTLPVRPTLAAAGPAIAGLAAGQSRTGPASART